jgi:hypothetical protein
MFSFNRKHFIDPELSKYIKEQHNKWLINYSNNSVLKDYPGVKVSDLVKHKNEGNIFPNSSFIFISLISFLAGYNFCYLTKKV